MIEIAQLLIGGFWIALIACCSWLAGLIMGLGIAKLASLAGRRGTDVDELLKAQRARDLAGRSAGHTAAPSAAGK